jgi:hypothetical protein
MPLEIGSRIGAYEVLGSLGAGGPAFAREGFRGELRRGLAIAQQRPRP